MRISKIGGSENVMIHTIVRVDSSCPLSQHRRRHGRRVWLVAMVMLLLLFYRTRRKERRTRREHYRRELGNFGHGAASPSQKRTGPARKTCIPNSRYEVPSRADPDQPAFTA